MKILTAPELYTYQNVDILCFLAGGITNCEDWQSTVIQYLKNYNSKNIDSLKDLIVFNPRRKNFNVNNLSESDIQIEWEFNQLQNMDIFSMYFAESASNQPICLYELGRNVERMMRRFPHDYNKRILVTCHPNYSRIFDVKKQLNLAMSNTVFNVDISKTYEIIADKIIDAYKHIKNLSLN